jgi:hypothetical protein
MRYVKYVGLSHERMILASDWRSVGIEAQTVAWTAQNGFAVPLDQFTDAQMRKAIDPDPELMVTGEDEDFKPQPQSRTMTPSQVVQVTEEPVDVLGMVSNDADASTGHTEASGGRPVPNTDDVPDAGRITSGKRR